MARELSANGMRRATAYVGGDYADTFAINKAALVAVHTERLQLMAERSVIEEYNAEQKNGS